MMGVTRLSMAMCLLSVSTFAAPTAQGRRNGNSACRQTSVAIIGGGVAGITAA
ncbi:hypothetical protein HBI82_026180, partial [Parastagonospora nodorum]